MTTFDLTIDRDAASVRTVVTAAGLVGALGSAVFAAAALLTPGLNFRETVLTPLSLTDNALTAIAFTALALSLPGLSRVTGLSRWSLLVSSAGCVAVAAFCWAYVSTAPHMASVVTDKEFSDFSGYLLMLGLPKMLLCAVGFVSLGISGLRRRVLSRGPAILLIVAGVASLVWAYAPGGLLAGLALAWTARTATPLSTSGRPL